MESHKGNANKTEKSLLGYFVIVVVSNKHQWDGENGEQRATLLKLLL